MTDKKTVVYIPGVTNGFADVGEWEPAEMIERLRSQARRNIATAEKILASADTDFIVETYNGSYAQRNRKQLHP